MKIAACSSITSARLALLTSMPINARSTAAVESRSSHNAMARSVRPAKLRAKARVDCARGPSLPSMLMGSPSTKPTALRSPAIVSSRAASDLKALRCKVSTPVASRRSGSETATPMVLVPKSRPTSAPRSGQCAAASIRGRMGAGIASHSTLFAMPAKREARSRDGAADMIWLVRGQARNKAIQRAVLMRAAARDKERVNPRPGCIEGVGTDALALIAALDHRARQQCDAHVDGDTANHAVERAQFEPRCRRPAKFRKHLLEPLPIGAAGAEHERGWTGFRRASAQAGEVCPAAGGDQHQLFAECRNRAEFGMLDRAGHKGAVQRPFEHGGKQIRRRCGPQRQPDRRKAPM